MANCQRLNWALLWAEWSLRSGKAWGAPWLPPLSSAPQYTSLLTKEVGCLRRKVVTSHCVVLWTVCAAVSGLWILVQMSDFSCFPFYTSFQRQWFIDCWKDLVSSFTWERNQMYFQLLLGYGSSSLVLPLWRVAYADSMKRFLRLSEMTLHFFCMIKLWYVMFKKNFLNH